MLKRASWGICVAVSLLLCLSNPASATQYRLKTWTVENGLPQNVIRGIAQTPDGYLWIATLDGVARFDGVRFTVFNKSNTPGILSNRFSSMVQDHNGDLWFTNENKSLTRYHHGTFHTFGPEEGVPSNSVRGIALDGAGNLSMLSEDAILRWDDGTGTWLDVTPDGPAMRYQPFHWGKLGFWAQSKTELRVLFDGHLTAYHLPDWLASGSLWDVGADENGAIWLESLDGKQGFVASGRQIVESVDIAHPNIVSYDDEHGHRWKTHVGQHLVRLIDFESSGETISIPITRLLEDGEQNIWVGTEGKGLYELHEQSLAVYSKAQGLIDRDIYPVFEDHAGTVWMGAWQSGLSGLRDGRVTSYTPAQGLPGRLVSALGEDRNGNLWVGTHGGLGILSDGHFRKLSPAVLPSQVVVQALLEDRAGTMWLGTSDGLVAYRDGPSRMFTTQDGLASNDVRVIIQSSSGDIWIGGYGGLSRIHSGQITHWTEQDGLPSSNIRALYEDSDGVLWIGSYDGGLGRLKDGVFTRYTEQDGLYNNGVFQILEDGNNNLWMSCNRGLYRVSKRELNAFAAKQRTTVTSIAYGKADGMLNVECNGGLWPAGIKTQDGKLWFPTQDGVAVVDPRVIHINPKPPPVIIEAVVIDRLPRVLNKDLTVQPGQENLAIDYTAPSFVRSDQIRFRYKLEGLDSAWIDAGNRRTAYYSHLPPREYTFHVIADNSDGMWNEVGQSLTITVLAPVYRRWWFVALEGLALVALIAIVFAYRISQLKRAQSVQKAFSQQLIASQESERRRIASELHDSLGQRLIVINNLALLSMRSRPDDLMREISEELLLAIQETREISYNLRPFQLDRLGLTKAIEIVARAVSSASGTTIACLLDNIDDVLPKDLRINFYRIVQEGLNNVMKHAHASEVEVKVTHRLGRLTLSISDNGRGFSASNSSLKSSISGFGLIGMKERADSLGGYSLCSPALDTAQL